MAYLFVVCALGDLSFGAFAVRLLFSFIIVTGVVVTFRQRWVRSFAIVLAVAGLALTWTEHIHQERSLSILSAVVSMLFMILLLAILIVQVFQTGTVTAHRIRGAIVVYLLLGGMWTSFYFIVALIIPHSFHWPVGLASDNRQAVHQVLTYFSFTALSTAGFGDITPAIPLTRTLAVFEALTGQLYLVTVLARLVSLSAIYPNVPHKPDRKVKGD
ncbi:MAG: ion channel [Desulfobaccales bacterium]|jgi:hypothetical protein